MTAYVCTEHTTEPVTWKGTGCRLCERRQVERRVVTRDSFDAETWSQWRGSSPVEGGPR